MILDNLQLSFKVELSSNFIFNNLFDLISNQAPKATSTTPTKLYSIDSVTPLTFCCKQQTLIRLNNKPNENKNNITKKKDSFHDGSRHKEIKVPMKY